MKLLFKNYLKIILKIELKQITLSKIKQICKISFKSIFFLSFNSITNVMNTRIYEIYANRAISRIIYKIIGFPCFRISSKIFHHISHSILIWHELASTNASSITHEPSILTLNNRINWREQYGRGVKTLLLIKKKTKFYSCIKNINTHVDLLYFLLPITR